MYFISFVISVLIKIAVTVNINQNDDGVDGVLIKRAFIGNVQTAAATTLLCPEKVTGFLCAEDCKTLLTCLINTPPLNTSICAKDSPHKPYCIPGSNGCTNIPNNTIPQCTAAQTPTFTCTDIGYFPDPSNCTLYHICTRDYQETYQCPPQYVFDATHIKCKRKVFFKDSCTVDCTQLLHQYVPYPGHKAYYAYCDVNEITMYKCGDIKHFQFNLKTLKCEFICKSAGWFPNYKNCQEYYECYKHKNEHNGGRGLKWLKSRIHTCPPNFIYDSNRRQCREGVCVNPEAL